MPPVTCFLGKGPLLHLAVAHGDINLCEQLISENPDLIEYLDEKKRSAFHVAAFYGHASIIQLLFTMSKQNASKIATKVDANYRIALYYAAQNNHLAVCDTLVVFTSIATVTRGTFSPLEVACDAGHTEIILFFLQQGVFVPNDYFQTAVETGRIETIKLLLAYRNRAQCPVEIEELLFTSCMKNDVECTKLLLDAGADPYKLFSVAGAIEVGCHELFLERGYHMIPPLRGLKHIINYFKSLAIFQDHDIILNEYDYLNETATYYENSACIHVLLESGIDFDTYISSELVRKMSLTCENTDVLSIMIDRLGDNKPSYFGPMVKRLLQSQEDDKATAIIQQYCHPKKKQAHRWLRTATYHNCLYFVSTLLDHYELDIDATGSIGKLSAGGMFNRSIEMTALLIAVQRGSRDVAFRLVAAGANVNRLYSTPAQPLSSSEAVATSSSLKLTLLMVSCAQGQVEEVKLLLALGARVNIKDELQGDTALHFALRLCHDPQDFLTEKHLINSGQRLKREEEQRRIMNTIVLALLAAGADPTITNEEDTTPLDIVQRCGNLRLVTAIQQSR